MPNKVFLLSLYFSSIFSVSFRLATKQEENLDFSINFPISRVDRRVVVGLPALIFTLQNEEKK